MSTKLNLLISAVLIISGAACSEDVKIPFTDQIEYSSELDSYVVEVLHALPYTAPYALPRVALVDNFDNLPFGEVVSDSTIGLCRSFNTGQPIEILINKEFWERASDLQKTTLVAHEMLHCMYNLDHSDKGIMYPSIHVAIHDVAIHGLEVALANSLGVEL